MKNKHVFTWPNILPGLLRVYRLANYGLECRLADYSISPSVQIGRLYRLVVCADSPPTPPGPPCRLTEYIAWSFVPISLHYNAPTSVPIGRLSRLALCVDFPTKLHGHLCRLVGYDSLCWLADYCAWPSVPISRLFSLAHCAKWPIASPSVSIDRICGMVVHCLNSSIRLLPLFPPPSNIFRCFLL